MRGRQLSSDAFKRSELDRSPLQTRSLLSQPIWGELRTFLAVAKSPSFAKAADVLRTSPHTVSRDVKRLQDQLGAKLVVAGFDGIKLTDAGRKLARELTNLDFRLFALANGLKEEKAGEGIAGFVSVSVSSGLAFSVVAPGARQLAKLHPKIELNFREQISFQHFENNQCDVMVSVVPINRAGIQCNQIGTLHLIPVCGIEYINKVGSMPDRGTLWNHTFLQCSLYQTESTVWDDWNSAAAEGKLTHHCENSLTYYALVKGGAGIGLVGSYMLADPFLVPIELGVHIALPIYLVAEVERLTQPAIMAVQKWISDLFASNPFFSSDLYLYTGQSSAETELRRLFKVNTTDTSDVAEAD